MKKTKSQKVKEKKTNSKAMVPEVMDQSTHEPVMDGTSVTEFSIMQNIDYASEIIQGAREAFNPKKLNQEKNKGTEYFLQEGERQIFKLWHSVVALDTHNTLFITLFLIAIGEILNKISDTLKPHEFSKWRRKTFHYKHERYLQQAQQLANIGPFATKYAAMGKKRLLALDHLRKTKKVDDCKELLKEHPLPKQVEENLPTYKELKANPFPDLTEDLEGTLIKEHADALVTHDRLKEAGIKFATFEQASLIAAYNKDAITKKAAGQIKAWLNKKRNTSQRKQMFERLLLDKMVIPEKRPRKERASDSLNQLLANFVAFSDSIDVEDEEWIQAQRAQIETNLFKESFKFMTILGMKLGIELPQIVPEN